MHRTFVWPGGFQNSVLEAAKDKKVRSLWITGPSPGLQEKLVRIPGLQPARILCPEISDDTDTLSKPTLELVAEAILPGDVRYVVVCGQPNDVPLHFERDQGSTPESESSYRQMVRRIAARLDRQQRVQNRIRTQLEQIRTIPGVACALKSCAVRLYGMFYIPESDTFLVYDHAKDLFAPIGEA